MKNKTKCKHKFIMEFKKKNFQGKCIKCGKLSIKNKKI